MAQLVVRLPGSHEVVCSNPHADALVFLAENIPVLSGRLVSFSLWQVRYASVEKNETKLSVQCCQIFRIQR